jgi:hypothetical protein
MGFDGIKSQGSAEIKPCAVAGLFGSEAWRMLSPGCSLMKDKCSMLT